MSNRYFHLDDWDSTGRKIDKVKTPDAEQKFNVLCDEVMRQFQEKAKTSDRISEDVDMQKNAIIGKDDAVEYYKAEISDYIRTQNKGRTWFPDWYDNLVDAIFHENWGFAGLAEFFSDKYKDSSSAKIIGQDIFFMVNGRQTPMPQKISYERRQRLVRALCMDNQKTRFDIDAHEVYMEDRSRITIFTEGMTNKNRDSIIVRRYVVPEYSFEVQASRGTIPMDAIPLLVAMNNLNYNTMFTGAVRTAKTTFLATWLSYYDKTLEGVVVQTDPELTLDKILPCAPVEDIVVSDENKMRKVVPKLLRSDADWMAFGEARDGLALNTALEVAHKGTRGMAMTYHTRYPENVARDIAHVISNSEGGDMRLLEESVAESFDYIFHFVQLSDKSKKRLKSIHEIRYNREKRCVETKQICKYNFDTDDWKWISSISADKIEAGREESVETMENFISELDKLSNGKKEW